MLFFCNWTGLTSYPCVSLEGNTFFYRFIWETQHSKTLKYDFTLCCVILNCNKNHIKLFFFFFIAIVLCIQVKYSNILKCRLGLFPFFNVMLFLFCSKLSINNFFSPPESMSTVVVVWQQMVMFRSKRQRCDFISLFFRKATKITYNTISPQTSPKPRNVYTHCIYPFFFSFCHFLKGLFSPLSLWGVLIKTTGHVGASLDRSPVFLATWREVKEHSRVSIRPQSRKK